MNSVNVTANLVSAESSVTVSASTATGGQLLSVTAGAYDVTVVAPGLPLRLKWRVGTSGDWSDLEGGEGFSVSGSDSTNVYLAKYAPQASSVAVAVTVRTVGAFKAGDASVSVGGGGSLDSSPGSDCVLVIGQSNAVGNGATFDVAHYDPIDTKIWRYVHPSCAVAALSAYKSKITIATDPLGHPDTLAGMGPGIPFAREYLRKTGRRILLIPLAVQATPLVTTTPPTWNSTVSSSLCDQAIAGANAAIKAAGPGSRVVAIVFAHGETDSIGNVTGANYSSALVALVAKLRANIATAANAPVIVTGMVPEFASGTHAQIRAVQQSVSTLVANSVYVAGTASATGDNLHYTESGQRIMGAAAGSAAIPLALTDAAPVLSVSLPVSIAVGTTITPTTSVVGSPYPAITYQYSLNGVAGAMQTTDSYTVPAGSAGKLIRCAVTATNAAGVGSATSAPVTITATSAVPESFFSHAAVPSGSDQTSAFVIGMRYTPSVAGVISKIVVPVTGFQLGAALSVGLYTSSGATTPAATASATGRATAGWQEFTLSVPVTVAAGAQFVAALASDSGHFFGLNGGGPGYPQTAGNLRADGAYYTAGSTIANPGSAAPSANILYCDVVFTPS